MCDDIHPATLDAAKLLAQCDLRRQRRSGPGGQHRNKVETAVILTHRPTGVSAEANERRSAAANQRVAIKRLRVRLALEVRTADGSRPSEVWSSRCRSKRIAVSTDHADFPSLLSEALDSLHVHRFDARLAAEELSVSTSQFIGLLRKEFKALELLNRHREELGLRPYK